MKVINPDRLIHPLIIRILAKEIHKRGQLLPVCHLFKYDTLRLWTNLFKPDDKRTVWYKNNKDRAFALLFFAEIIESEQFPFRHE